MVLPAYGAVVLAKLMALKAGAIFATVKLAGVSYKIIYAGCKIIGTVSQYCFVATAGAVLVAGAVYVTKVGTPYRSGRAPGITSSLTRL